MSWGIWVVIAIILIIAEFLTAGFVSIFFGIGAALTAVISVFTSSIPVQLLCFAVVSLIMVLVGRPVMKKLFKIDKDVKFSTVDAIIGKQGIVVKDITGMEYGLVKIDGDTWTASSAERNEIKIGTKVEVESIDGVKVVVRETL